jgi:hypothetical protein
VEWIVLEEVDEGAARLVALRPSTGERRLLYRSEHPFPLRPSVHPDGTRVALDAVSRNVLRGEYRARVGVVNLESGGIGWLKQSLDPKWRVGGAVFDDTGKRLAIEGAFGGAPLTEIYVLEVGFTGNSAKETIVAGAGNRQALGTAAPRFLPGGRRLVYLHNTRPDGGWEVYLLDLDQSGESAFSMEGRAPSVLSIPLTEGALALPDAGLTFSPERERVFFVGQTRSRTRQRLRWTPLDGGGVVDLSREHLRVEEIVAAPGTDLVAYAADGNVYLADAESCEVQILVRGEPTSSHRGLIFDRELGALWFTTTDTDGAVVRMVDLDTREVRDVLPLGPGVAVVHALGLPDTNRAHTLVQQLPDAAAVSASVITQTRLADLGDDDRATAVTRMPSPGMDTTPNYDTRESSTAVTPIPRPRTEALLPPPPKAAPTPSPNPRPAPVSTPAPASVQRAPALIPVATPRPVEAQSTPEPARSMPDPSGVSMEVTDSMELEPRTGLHRIEKAHPLPAQVPGDPREDFVGWMKNLGSNGAPSEQLRRLAGADVIEDPRLRDAARMYLGLQVRKANNGGDGLSELVNAIGAAGYLRLHESESALRQLCERCRERLRAEAGLPEVEEHYALAAIRAVRLGQRFDFDEVYEEYESMLAQSATVLENGGESAVARVIASFGQMYLDLIAEALDQPVNPLAGAADARRARERMTGNLAAVGRSPTLAGVAAPPRAATGRHPVVTAPEPVATPAPVSAPKTPIQGSPVVQAAQAPAPQPRPSAVLFEPAPEPQPRAPTPIATPVRVADDDEAEFRRLRARAEASAARPAPTPTPAPVHIAQSTGQVRLEEDDDAEFRRLRARAEAAARSTPLPAQRTPSRSDFNPFGGGLPTPIPPPATPLATWPAPPRTGATRWPTPAESLDLDPLTSGVTGEISLASLPPPPWYLQIVGGAAGIGGLIEVLLGVKLGLVFLILGFLSLATGFGVLGDRRWGHLAAGPVFASNAVFLLVYAADNPPTWVPPMALLFGAAAAALAFVVMLLPDVRVRYTTRRGRL